MSRAPYRVYNILVEGNSFTNSGVACAINIKTSDFPAFKVVIRNNSGL